VLDINNLKIFTTFKIGGSGENLSFYVKLEVEFMPSMDGSIEYWNTKSRV
jgi:hypothetical protein